MKKICCLLFLICCSSLYSESYLNLKTTIEERSDLVSNIQNATFNNTEMVFKCNNGTIIRKNLDDIINITFSSVPHGDMPLPVQLLSFTALSGNNRVVLKWSTASEVENDAFIIERSVNNEYFLKIAEIQGQGTASHRTDYSFVDDLAYNDMTYYYRLADRDVNGVITYHSVVNATPNANANNSNPTDLVVDQFVLYKNFPNPFNPETTIKFDIPAGKNASTKIKLNIYNALGQLVAELYDGSLTEGQYEVIWNADDFPSGIYYVSFQSNVFNKSQKMMLVK